MEPTESQEQQYLFTWIRSHEKIYPELKLVFSTLNGVRLRIGAAKKAVTEGNRRGVPDVLGLFPRGKYNGIALEMKRVKSGRLSPEQKEFLSALSKQGYFAVCCRGGKMAVEILKAYMRANDEDLERLIKKKV